MHQTHPPQQFLLQPLPQLQPQQKSQSKIPQRFRLLLLQPQLPQLHLHQ